MLKVHTTNNKLIKTDCLVMKKGMVECWFKHKMEIQLFPEEIKQIIPNIFELDKNSEPMREAEKF